MDRRASEAAHRDRARRRRRASCSRRRTATLAPYWLYCEAPRRGALHRERDATRRACSACPNAHAVRQGRVPRVSSSHGRHDAVNPARSGHQGRAALRRRRSAPARRSSVRLRLTQRGERCAQPLGAGVRRDCSTRASRRPTRSTSASRRSSCRTDMRNVQRQAFAGHAVEQAVLPLHRSSAGSKATRSGRRRPSARRHGRNHDWWHFVGGRRAVDAGQVGVPVVRRVGHGVPLRRRSR